MIDKLTSLKNFIQNSRSAQLAVIAGLSGLVYALIFTLRFPLAGLYRTIPPVDYTKLTHYSPAGVATYLLSLVVLFWLYLWAIRLATPTAPLKITLTPSPCEAPPIGGKGRGESRQRRGEGFSSLFVLLSSAFLAAVSIPCYPLTAIDLFVYAIWTRGWALYGLNPLTTMPEMLPASDPWLGLAGEWVAASSPYGPVWELLSRGAFHLSGGDFLAHLIALKILAALAYLGCVWLVYDLLRRIRPEWAAAGAIAFAWNPLVLLESAQNGHNDIVMTFFLLAAAWTVTRWSAASRRVVQPVFLLTCLCLTLSILVKFVTAIVVPFFLMGMASVYAKKWQRLAVILGYGLLIAGLVTGGMLPFWPGLKQWAVLQTGAGAGRSLTALLVLSFKELIGTNPAFEVTRYLIFTSFALIYLYYLWKTLMQIANSKGQIANGNTQSEICNLQFAICNLRLVILPAFSVLFWYVLIAAPVFHAWYLLWFAPLASLLLPQRRYFNASIVFSLTALLVIPYFETVRVWYPILLDNQLLGHILAVPLLIAPPAVAFFRKG